MIKKQQLSVGTLNNIYGQIMVENAFVDYALINGAIMCSAVWHTEQHAKEAFLMELQKLLQTKEKLEKFIEFVNVNRGWGVMVGENKQPYRSTKEEENIE